jgi:hypothetical protein
VRDVRNAYRILVGETLGKCKFVRARRRWRVDLRWILKECVVRIAGVCN